MAETTPTPINKFLPFDPVRVREIIDAFDDACRALPDQPPSDKVRDILAKFITEAAQRGEVDRVTLRDEALAHLRRLTTSKSPS
jgi:hypothetical protein